MDKFDVLSRYFGYTAFRKGQEEVVDCLLSGGDSLAIMPTGAGKSVCYQVPAIMLSGITIVISPLISLMKDQVNALVQQGIKAAYINRSLTDSQYDRVLKNAAFGAYKIIYVAPERLDSSDFTNLCRKIKISMVAVDEAHCVSQWGQDFRPSYLKIAAFIASLAQRPTVGAFTATATEQVKADIKKLLELRKPLEVTTGFDRPNLYFDVIEAENKNSYLKSFLTEHRGQSGIIYCATRKGVEAVCEHLVKDGFSAVRYHAGLTDEERRGNQELFVYDQAQVMVATNAFGMGIDKSNVSFVIHYNMPQSLESYYQEAGRAGRDGSPAACILLFSNADIHTAKYLILHAEENDELTPEERAAVQQADLKRLNRMVDYCKTTACLRKNILSYFGEEAPSACGNCGNCKREIIRQDMTLEAQKILSAVTRVERRYPYGLGVTLIVRMLHGSKEQRILDLGLNEFSTYGIMHDTDRKIIRNYIEHLIQEGYLTLSEEYPVLHTTEKARAVLYNGEKVFICQRREKAPVRKKTEKQSEIKSDLFDYLRTVRLELAKQEKVPAYIILSNAALSDMAMKLPHTRQELLNVSGIGEVKAQRYGDVFLQAIQSWESNEHKS